jgi:sigma-B regulation protein RsbU (phosphoserine phosphatase)
LLERNEAYRQLAESQRQLAEEIAQAANYVRSLLPERLTGEVRIDWRFVPSTQLGGDMFGYHWLDKDHLAIYLLDVSGHGVGSSLLAVSAMNVLAAGSLPQTDFRDPGQVLGRLNDVFQMDRQDGKYFTIFYGVFRRSDRTLAYSNGGHPPALLFAGPTEATAALRELGSTDPMVGMLPPGVPFHSARVPLEPHTRMLVYSDGTYEIARPVGEMWQHREFVELVKGLPPDEPALPDRLLAHVRKLHGNDVLDDDFSILEVRF